MHKTTTVRALVSPLLAGALIAAGATAAAAAWVAAAPASGGPTVWVENPDYVPGRPAVDHPATWQRWSWNPAGGVASAQTPDVTGSNPIDNPADWTANTTNYAGAGNGTDPVGVAFQAAGGQNGSWFFWTGGPGWTEPAVPPVGEPTIEVDNPDYVEAGTIDDLGTVPPQPDRASEADIGPAAPAADAAVAMVLADPAASAPDDPVGFVADTGGTAAGSSRSVLVGGAALAAAGLVTLAGLRQHQTATARAVPDDR